jgi:hypothetical protein
MTPTIGEIGEIQSITGLEEEKCKKRRKKEI